MESWKKKCMLKSPRALKTHKWLIFSTFKALYGLKQAPRLWYDTLSTFLLKNKCARGVVDKTLVYKHHGKDIILVQIYVDDIIFGSTNEELYEKFSYLMRNNYEMSMMGKLSFFLGLQVYQNEDGIFIISQAKYVKELLKKLLSMPLSLKLLSMNQKLLLVKPL